MKHILILDDDKSIRKVFSSFLTNEGYAVDCAINGKEGLRLLEADPPDLVITDIMMPETDGLEVVLAMRHIAPKTPVFAISGGMRSAPINFLPTAKDVGACKVFHKPVELSTLLAAVREELDT